MTDERRISWARAALVTGVAALALAVSSVPAGACGGLVGENGTIQLVRTTTLAAYHAGIERYVTSFAFTGAGKEVGSIVPLPAIPTSVERGGDWTLQRLVREVAPPVAEDQAFAAKSASPAEVILETKIDALDITVIKGGGDAVGKWALDHGFFLSPDAPEVLDFYAARSPIFMAARFDASRAAALGQRSGDGTPIMVTMPTDRPWVPLRILGLGAKSAQVIDADVFLLTDTEPKLLAGGRGLTLDRSEAASPSLLTDLRSDKGMGWVPSSMWFTHLPLQAAAGDLDYDLAIAVAPHSLPRLTDAGISSPAAVVPRSAGDDGVTWWPWAAGIVAAVLAFAGLRGVTRRGASGIGA
jgi:Uncharacterized protein conserved in bacteria (DUF2330)